jgi:hypothetical protein
MTDGCSQSHFNPFAAKLTLGFVGRGTISSVQVFVEGLRRFAEENGVDIVFLTTSGSKLWIKEGEP